MWARALTALAGLWLMAAPGVFDYAGAAGDNARIVGPLLVAVAVIAHAEVTRPVRWAAVPLGVWLVLSAWPLGGGAAAIWSAVLIGALALALACVRGRIRQRYGGGWSALWSASGRSMDTPPQRVRRSQGKRPA